MIAEETGDERILARGLYSLGMVDQKAGKLREADAKLLRSVEICRRRSLTGPLVTDLTWLSAHADWRGEYRPSLQYGGEAARLAEASHEGFYELVSLCFLCNAHAGLGEWDLAFKFLDEVRQKSRERENKYGIARGMNTTGWLHQQLGDLRHSVDLDRQALDFGRSAKLGNPEIYSTINLAEDHLCLNEIGAAETILIDAAGAPAHRSVRLAPLEMADAGRSHVRPPLPDEGRSRARRFPPHRGARGSPSRPSPGATWPRDTGSAARSGSRPGEREDARAELRRALEVAESTASPRTIWETAGALGRALGPAREAEARDAYRRAIEVAARSAAEDSPPRAQGHPPRVRTGRPAPRGGGSPRCHASAGLILAAAALPGKTGLRPGARSASPTGSRLPSSARNRLSFGSPGAWSPR